MSNRVGQRRRTALAFVQRYWTGVVISLARTSAIWQHLLNMMSGWKNEPELVGCHEPQGFA